MEDLMLVPVSCRYAEALEEYYAAFPVERERATFFEQRIPGMDHREEYTSAKAWLQFCDAKAGKIDWYMTVRVSDGKIVGMIVFRHKLEYDDDDAEFSSHIGYSIRPEERNKGYAKYQLHLVLEKAREAGTSQVRIVCRDTNIASQRIILANGGVYRDTIYGEESGMFICRYDINLA